MDAGQVSSTFITPRMESGSTLVVAALTYVVAIAQETGIEPKLVLPALIYLRLAFQTDRPYLFSATVGIDET